MLREAEIGDLDVTVVVDENVFRFEVPIDDVEAMKVMKGESDLCSVKLGYRIRESLMEKSETMIRDYRSISRLICARG